MAKWLIGVIAPALWCRRGAAMVEYAILAALIATVAVVALRSLGTTVSTKFSSVTTAV